MPCLHLIISMLSFLSSRRCLFSRNLVSVFRGVHPGRPTLFRRCRRHVESTLGHGLCRAFVPWRLGEAQICIRRALLARLVSWHRLSVLLYLALGAHYASRLGNTPLRITFLVNPSIFTSTRRKNGLLEPTQVQCGCMVTLASLGSIGSTCRASFLSDRPRSPMLSQRRLWRL